eukprot:scaffold230795_cov36-Tisochrysis_lutea.AAC.1
MLGMWAKLQCRSWHSSVPKTRARNCNWQQWLLAFAFGSLSTVVPHPHPAPALDSLYTPALAR